MISEQIELLDPLATSLRRPAAQRLLSSSTLVLSEYICYIVSLGGIAVTAFMHKIFPFSVLSDVFYNPQTRNRIGGPNLLYLSIAVYGLAAICIMLTFILGRVARETRLKNEILYHAGKDIKTIVGQHLVRKAALETLEQRHLLASGINEPARPMHTQPMAAATTPFRAPSVAINEIRNPGFD